MGKGRLLVGTAAACFALAAVASAAAAQDAVSVLDRPRPEYDPVGGRVGSFFIYPKAEVETRYDTNIFATQNNAKDDFIGVFSPQISIQSDWTRHALNASAGAEIGRYADFSGEDYEDFFLKTNGRLDVLRSTTMFGDVNLSKLHEERGSPDDVNGKTPTEYYDLNGGVSGAYQVSRIALFGNARYQYLDYNDVQTSAGTTINNDDRDRGVATTGARVGYEIIPNYLAFVSGEYNNRDYVTSVDDSGLNRDSQGYDISVGTQFRLSGITRGEVSAGWQQQFYKDSQLNDISGFSFKLGVTWFASELTTVDFSGARTIEETTIVGASGYLNSSIRVDVAHELRRNIILTGGAGFADNDYQGIDRTDYLFDGSIGAKYLINRNFYVGANYEFTMRNTNVDGSDYKRSVVMLRGGVQF
ncbi:hypothetical protein SAMN06265365_104207 [Tistlia consotensis]|uniref:Beta-barrel porin 2 n=1 Tax=Tistlia consotensis USBA 355 TaxID=560819 RepID=A0A1Y6BU22_9PROT|nr:outer membrane beta-barrel protein [Tistlia consotensis]SMF21287.1 hypothetical protein SAMN05428998_10787 [Tistlia consotensis USBA 355]SNR47074.1 hypothetical protein SAMN06265365_104207 [Tistlia consotensis]